MALHIDRYVGDEEVLCDGTVYFNGVDRGLWDLRITPTRIIASCRACDSVSVIYLRQICFVNLCHEGSSPKYSGWNVEIFCGNIRCNTLVAEELEQAEMLFYTIQRLVNAL
jgi:hypothetical protein